MKIQYFYDVICPYSWLGYQIIQQKQPIWKACGKSVQVSFIPFASPFVYNRSVGFQRNDSCTADKTYRIKHLTDVADHYGFKKGDFERMYSDKIRTKSTLLFLNILRRKNPEWHTLFMELFWQTVFLENRDVCSINDYLRLARESNIPYSQISDFILQIEQRENVLSLDKAVSSLIEKKIVGSPWIQTSINNIDMDFCNILYLELIDQTIRDPLAVPLSSKLDRISSAL